MAKCILIVDDDRGSIELAKRVLQSKGYEITTAQDGLQALEALKKGTIDLILLDVQMPTMDGYTFIMKKSSDPAIANIPVICLSAMEKTEPLFKRHGVKAYIIKPLNTQDLLDNGPSGSPHLTCLTAGRKMVYSLLMSLASTVCPHSCNFWASTLISRPCSSILSKACFNFSPAGSFLENAFN